MVLQGYELNQNANKVFQKLINHCQNNDSGTKSAKIDNGGNGIMPVSIEILVNIDFCGYSARLISIAHYFEMNGDLVPDPDMEFIIIDDFSESDKFGKPVFPVSIQNQFYFDRAIDKKDGKWKYSRKKLRDLVDFANIWLKNIAEQQDL